MKFEILNKSEFNNFLDRTELNNFLQSPLMDGVALLKGQKVYYVGIKENNKILCAARILCINSRFGKKIFYSPRGILIDYNDTKLLNMFIKELKKFVKSKGGFELIIDPNILYKQRDIDGNIVEKGFDNSNIISSLKKLGFNHLGFTKGNDTSRQVRWQFVINLKSRNEDDILKSFKPNTRNLISKARKQIQKHN